MNKPLWTPERREFSKSLLAVALPMTVQNFLMTTCNMIDVVMIGALGDVDIAAAGVANQVYFVYSLILFGIYSGSAVFLSQFWGQRDVKGIRQTMGYMLIPGLLLGLLFTVFAEWKPQWLMEIYSTDLAVIESGAKYLQILGTSYLLGGLTFCYSFACRCSGNVKLPMFTSLMACCINIVFNYIFIFGKLGCPAMGLAGAAWATLLSRVVEFIVLVLVVYAKKLPAAARPAEMFHFNRDFTKRYLKTVTPVLINESLWSIGTTQYTVIFGIVGTAAQAAYQIVGTVFNMFMILARSLSNAAAVIIGNKIGAGDEHLARTYGKRLLLILGAIGLFMAGLMLVTRTGVLSLFNTSEEVRNITLDFLSTRALFVPIMYISSLIIVGICRAGGDTIYAAINDLAPVWLVALPLGYIGAASGWPVEVVFLLINCEEVFKVLLGVPRVLSGKWVHNVIKGVTQTEPALPDEA